MTTYESLGLDQTVRVGLNRYPEWGSPLAVPGPVEYGIEVPHQAANLRCYQPLGTARDPESGITYDVLCKKRAGHDQPKGEAPHVPVDTRIVASPTRVVHSRRFMPNGTPAGVDLNVTLPHDCANHLDG